MVDIYTVVLTGFASGIGTGLSNWLIVKRLEHIENKVKGKMNREGEKDETKA
jgi:hypothetical protein